VEVWILKFNNIESEQNKLGKLLIMKFKIIVVGSVNTDMVVKVEQLPQPGETVLGGVFIQARGGKGANQAVAAARLGTEVTFVARVGLDEFGKDAVASFESEGIDTKYIIWDK
jgi:ribokinase